MTRATANKQTAAKVRTDKARGTAATMCNVGIGAQVALPRLSTRRLLLSKLYKPCTYWRPVKRLIASGISPVSRLLSRLRELFDTVSIDGGVVTVKSCQRTRAQRVGTRRRWQCECKAKISMDLDGRGEKQFKLGMVVFSGMLFRVGILPVTATTSHQQIAGSNSQHARDSRRSWTRASRPSRCTP